MHYDQLTSSVTHFDTVACEGCGIATDPNDFVRDGMCQSCATPVVAPVDPDPIIGDNDLDSLDPEGHFLNERELCAANPDHWAQVGSDFCSKCEGEYRAGFAAYEGHRLAELRAEMGIN